jgi:hypothetical protein
MWWTKLLMASDGSRRTGFVSFIRLLSYTGGHDSCGAQ